MKKNKNNASKGIQRYSTRTLAKHLNDNFKKKKGGGPFSVNDIQQYLLRGKLPQYIGGHPITSEEFEDTGLKVISVDYSTTVKRKKT